MTLRRDMSLSRLLFLFVLVAAALLSNLRSLAFFDLHPAHGGLADQAWLEALAWLLASVAVLWLLEREGDLKAFISAWGRQRWLLGFLALCLASAFWSIEPSASAYRIVVLWGATWVAACIGARCRPEELLHYLSWLGAVIVLASITMALAEPTLGTDTNPGFVGIWRGVFWNKNHLGAVTAFFGTVFLLRLVVPGVTWRSAGGWLLLYAASLLPVVRAESAAGYFLALILPAVIALLVARTRFVARVDPRHRWALLVIAAALAVLILANLDIVFGMFNRTTTLTGRTKLWSYLLGEVVSERPWFGYGFGALWEIRDFRFLVKDTLGWQHPAMMADNGFMDILLNVGWVGLAVFLVVYAQAWRIAIRQCIGSRHVADGFPLLIMTFSLFANISFSFLAEIEMLVWCLVVTVLFSREAGVNTRCVP